MASRAPSSVSGDSGRAFEPGIPAVEEFPYKLWSRLAAHSWPGNVRELENALERVLAVPSSTDGAPIGAAELDFLERSREGGAAEVAQSALRMGLSVDDVTRAMMERALEEHRGNVSAAARAIGLTRRAFDYRLGRVHEGESES